MSRQTCTGVRIGRAFLILAAGAFFFGGLLALGLRWKLAFPDSPVPFLGSRHDWPGGVMPLDSYAKIFTLHGTIMVWLVAVPSIAWGLGLASVPRMCRTTLALPGLARLGLWVTLLGAATLLVGWAAAGWTSYAPLGSGPEVAARWVPYRQDVASWLRLETGDGFYRNQSRWSLLALGANWVVVSLGLSTLANTFVRVDADAEAEASDSGERCSILRTFRIRSFRFGVPMLITGIAFVMALPIVRGLQTVAFDGQTAWFTAVALWAIGGGLVATSLLATVALRRRHVVALSVWGWAAAAAVGLLAGPVIVLAMVMNLLDAHDVTGFFDPTRGGQPLLHQHLFWFYGHPLVYLLILPAYGIASDILARHGRGYFGYKTAAGCIVAVSVLGFGVSAHHMYQSGLDPSGALVFSATTMLIGTPSAILVVTWLGTIRQGRPRSTAAVWAVLGFVSLFVIGGLSGLVLAAPAINVQLHDTYFVVAHLHYTLFGGSLFALFAGLYWLWPRLTGGRRLNQSLGKWHVALTYVAFNGTFGLMHVLGILGMPRRYAEPTRVEMFSHLAWAQQTMTVFAIILGIAQLLLLANIVLSLVSVPATRRLTPTSAA